MSETAFSPGPWTFDGHNLLDRDMNRVVFSGHIGLAIAPKPQGWPNDCLLLAAPSLYEALRQLVGNAEIAKAHLPNTDEAHIVSSALFDTIGQANVALALARDGK